MYGDPRAEVFGQAAAGLSAGGGTGMDQPHVALPPGQSCGQGQWPGTGGSEGADSRVNEGLR